MRVVAGIARGRSLRAPAGRRTRPTSDRVRESLFDMLTSMDVIEGARVADLFAGSGALGIEALSRGAASAVFVESDREAVATIEANLAVLGDVATGGTVVRSDVLRWASGAVGSGGRDLDVVFADPPYAWTAWELLLAPLAGVNPLVVAETATGWAPPAGWDIRRTRDYGSTMLSLLRPAPIATDTPTPSLAHEHRRGGM